MHGWFPGVPWNWIWLREGFNFSIWCQIYHKRELRSRDATQTCDKLGQKKPFKSWSSYIEQKGAETSRLREMAFDLSEQITDLFLWNQSGKRFFQKGSRPPSHLKEHAPYLAGCPSSTVWPLCKENWPWFSEACVSSLCQGACLAHDGNFVFSGTVFKIPHMDTKLKGKWSPFGMFYLKNHPSLPDSPGNPIHTQRSHWLLRSLSKPTSRMEKMSPSWFHVGLTSQILLLAMVRSA